MREQSTYRNQYQDSFCIPWIIDQEQSKQVIIRAYKDLEDKLDRYDNERMQMLSKIQTLTNNINALQQENNAQALRYMQNYNNL